MDKKDRKIIILEDIFELRRQKEKELEYYRAQLTALQSKLGMLEREIRLTNIIISMIEKEKIVDIKEYMDEGD